MNYRTNNVYMQEAQPAEQPGAPASQAAAPAAAPKAKKKAAPKKAAKAKKPAKKAKSGAVKGVKGPGVLKLYAPQYKKGGKDGKSKTAGGNQTIDTGDALADKLRGKPLEDVYAMAAKIVKDEDDNAMSVQALKKKYGKLNVGMQRMNLGNRMRAVLNAK